MYIHMSTHGGPCWGYQPPRTSPGVSADHHVGGLKAPGNLKALALLNKRLNALNALYVHGDYLYEKKRKSKS